MLRLELLLLIFYNIHLAFGSKESVKSNRIISNSSYQTIFPDFLHFVEKKSLQSIQNAAKVEKITLSDTCFISTYLRSYKCELLIQSNPFYSKCELLQLKVIKSSLATIEIPSASLINLDNSLEIKIDYEFEDRKFMCETSWRIQFDEAGKVIVERINMPKSQDNLEFKPLDLKNQGDLEFHLPKRILTISDPVHVGTYISMNQLDSLSIQSSTNMIVFSQLNKNIGFVVGSAPNGFVIMDFTDPTSPTLISGYNYQATNYLSIVLNSNETIAFIFDNVIKWFALNISDLFSPKFIKFLPTVPGQNFKLMMDKYGFDISSGTQLKILNFTDQMNPSIITAFNITKSRKKLRKIFLINSDHLLLNIHAPPYVKVTNQDYFGDIAISSNSEIVLLAERNAGLYILNTTNLSAPTLLSLYSSQGGNYDLLSFSSDETFVIVSDRKHLNGSFVINISNLTAPTLISRLKQTGIYGYHTLVKISSNDLAAFLTDQFNLFIFNLTNISNPTFKSTNLGFLPTGLASSENASLVYIIGGLKGLTIYNIAPSTPRQLMINYQYKKIAISSDGNLAFLICREYGLSILNISDKSKPEFLSSYSGYFSTVMLSSDNKIAYIGGQSFQILNISNPLQPQFLVSHPISSWSDEIAIFPNETKAYLTSKLHGNYILNISVKNSVSRITVDASSTSPELYSVVLSSSGETAYIGGLSLLYILNVQNPATLICQGNLSLTKAYQGTISSDKNFIFYLSDKQFVIVNITTPANPSKFYTLSNDSYFSMAVSRDKYTIALATNNPTRLLVFLNVYNLKNIRMTNTYNSTYGQYDNLQFSPDDKYLYFTSIEGMHILAMQSFLQNNCSTPTPYFDYDSRTCQSCTVIGCKARDGPYCEPTSGYCLACNETGCSSPVPYCDMSNGYCQACNVTGCSAPNPICNFTSGYCQNCSEAGCSSPKPYCNNITGQCQACNLTGCLVPTPVCNLSSGYCQSCNETGCNSPKPLCNNATGVCESCNQTGCMIPKPQCNNVTGFCESCITKGCSVPLPYCNSSTGLCLNCLDMPCANPNFYCNLTTGMCQNCSETGCPLFEKCNHVTGICENCTSYGCNSPAPFCNSTSGCYSCFEIGCNNTTICSNVSGYCEQVYFEFQVEPYPYYVSSQSYVITATNLNSSSNSQFSWHIIPNLPFLNLDFNKIEILSNNNFLQQNELFLRIQVFDGTFQSGFYLIPINKSPENGSLVIIPSFGKCLTTFYNISTLGWLDTELPLTHQFSYFYSFANDKALLNDGFELSNYIQTQLPGDSVGLNPTVFIFGEIKDAFEAISNITNSTLCNCSSEINEVINIINTALSTLNSLPTSQQITTSNLIATQLFQMENSLINQTNTTTYGENPCPVCTGNGVCNSNLICTCLIDWTGFDCSVNLTNYNMIIQSKLELLSQVNNISSDSSNLNSTKLIATIELLSSNPNFNSFQTYSRAMDTLEQNFNITQTTLNDAQTKSFSSILDNIYSYLNVNDGCNSTSNFTKSFFNKSSSYFSTLTKSLVNEQLNSMSTAQSNQNSILTENFGIYAVQSSICSLSDLSIQTNNSQVPDLSLSTEINSSINCSQKILVQYLTLNSNLMSCNLSAPKSFSKIVLDIYDAESGTPLNIFPKVQIHFKQLEYVNCPAGCAVSGLDCSCSSTFFTFSTQFSGIFANSQLSNLIKIGNLKNFDFLHSNPFWIVISFLAITTILQYPLFKLKDYDIEDRLVGKKKILTLFMMAQPFIGIFMTREEISKTTRAILYYIRTTMTLFYYSIFGLDAQKDTSNIWNGISFSSISFNPYVFILPYFTITPINALIAYAMKKTFGDTISQSKILYAKKVLVVFSLIALLGFCNLGMIVISSTLNSSMINQWTLNFLLFQIQELFITPILILGLCFMISRVTKWSFVMKNTNLMNFMKNIPPKRLYQLLYKKRKIKRISRSIWRNKIDIK